jgi:hypothetical protein
VNPVEGSLQWGAYMYDWSLNYGWWTAAVFVNGVREDLKNQFYPPHGSLPHSKVPNGSAVLINVDHIFFTWMVMPFWIPEYGRQWGSWVAGRAYGSLQWCRWPGYGNEAGPGARLGECPA